MKKILIILPLIIILFSLACDNGNNHVTVPGSPTPDTTKFTASGRQILLNGNPVYFKGMCYQPTPVGASPNVYPNGDYYTSTYENIYEPDIDKMREMGVNAIKIYSWYPNADHEEFLNYCYNGNNDPIYVAVGYFMPAGTVISEFDIKLNSFIDLARKTKDHPAILGYMLGNENVGSDINNPDFWNKLNQISDTLKEIAPNKLTFTAFVDNSMNSIIAGRNYMTSLDVWGINTFRGRSLGDLYSTFAAATDKPLFITELGFPSSVRTNGVPHPMPDNGAAVGEYAGDVLREIELYRSDLNSTEVVAGVFWFIFSDEWWKQECPACWSPNGQPCVCTDSSHDFSKTASYSPFPGGWWDEEWFGLYTAENRTPRAAVDTIKTIWK